MSSPWSGRGSAGFRSPRPRDGAGAATKGRTAIRLICQRGRLVGSARNAKTSSTGRWICSVCSKSVIAGQSFALARPEIVTVRAVAPVDVMLLGPPRVERDGATVAFDTRKAVALLAVLALADRCGRATCWPNCCGRSTTPSTRAGRYGGTVRAALRGRCGLRGRDARQRLARAQRWAAGRRRRLPGRCGRGAGGRRGRRVPGRLPRGLRAARRAGVRGLAARRGRRAAARAGARPGAAGR